MFFFNLLFSLLQDWPCFATVDNQQRDCRRGRSLQWGPSSSNPWVAISNVSFWVKSYCNKMKSIDIILLRIITSVWAFLTLPPQGLSLTLLSVEDIWKPKVRNPMKMVDCVKIRNTLELRSWSQSWPAFQLLERKELSTCWEAPWNSQSVPLSTSCNYISQKAFSIKTSWCVIFTW